jgi:Fe-S cluster biogenesis protein NfuA
LAGHFGSIEIVDVSVDGTVRIRFLGMCTHCPLRPVTLAATVRRALLEVKGITRVEAIGVRISAEAEERLALL